MIRHIVMFRLAATDPAQRDADAAAVTERLLALQGVVPTLLDISVSRNVAYEGQNMDIALTAHFDDVAGVEAYQVHPAHVEAAQFIGTVRSERAAIDFEV
jgi:hypothetical protein